MKFIWSEKARNESDTNTYIEAVSTLTPDFLKGKDMQIALCVHFFKFNY